MCRSNKRFVFHLSDLSVANEPLEFAECAKGHMVSVNFTCRDQKLAMNSCFRKNGTLAEQDRAREEWFATRVQKKREAAEKEAERLKNVYAERKRLEEIEARRRLTETGKSSWWPFGDRSGDTSRADTQSKPEVNARGNGS